MLIIRIIKHSTIKAALLDFTRIKLGRILVINNNRCSIKLVQDKACKEDLQVSLPVLTSFLILNTGNHLCQCSKLWQISNILTNNISVKVCSIMTMEIIKTIIKVSKILTGRIWLIKCNSKTCSKLCINLTWTRWIQTVWTWIREPTERKKPGVLISISPLRLQNWIID